MTKKDTKIIDAVKETLMQQTQLLQLMAWTEAKAFEALSVSEQQSPKGTAIKNNIVILEETLQNLKSAFANLADLN